MARAIIFGASGLTGSALLDLLCKTDYYSDVICFVRKQIHVIHDKQQNVLTDFNDFEQHAAWFNNADIYCCLGTTTKKVKGDKDAYREADLFRPLRVAKMVKQHGGNQFLIISALGADVNSSIFYNRLKGELQNMLQVLQLPALHIFQPSLLMGNRTEKRGGERIAQILMPLLKPLLVGRFKKYRGIQVTAVASAMLQIAKQQITGNHIYTSEIIQQIADTNA